MTRFEAVDLIKYYYNEPIWNVKIGIGSPQLEGVDFEEALHEFDRCNVNFNTSKMEYIYIYPKDYLRDEDAIHQALDILGFGYGRKKRNVYEDVSTKAKEEVISKMDDLDEIIKDLDAVKSKVSRFMKKHHVTKKEPLILLSHAGRRLWELGDPE